MSVLDNKEEKSRWDLIDKENRENPRIRKLYHVVKKQV